MSLTVTWQCRWCPFSMTQPTRVHQAYHVCPRRRWSLVALRQVDDAKQGTG